jgi:hypothetical protein
LIILFCWSCNNVPPTPEDTDHGKKHHHDGIKLEKMAALPKEISESSALWTMDVKNFLTLNDSRGNSELFKVDEAGTIIRRFFLPDDNNEDWEEITGDDSGHVYIGDFGNNDCSGREFYGYRFNMPIGQKSDSVFAQDIRFTLPDQVDVPAKPKDMNFDFEAMIHSGRCLYLFSKNRSTPYSGYTKLYKVPDTPGEYVATLLDSMYTGDGPMKKSSITGASMSKNGKELVLTSHERIWFLSGFKGDQFFHGSITDHPFTKEGLSVEGVTFFGDDVLFFSEERSDPGTGELFRLDLSDYPDR